MKESQQEHVSVQCPHFIGFGASGMVVGIAGTTLWVLHEMGREMMQQSDLYAKICMQVM